MAARKQTYQSHRSGIETRLSGASLVPIRIGLDGLLLPDLPAAIRRTVGFFLFALHHFDKFNEYVLYTPHGGLKAMALGCGLPRWKVVETRVPLRPAWLRQLIHQSAFRFVAERDGLDIVHALTAISPFAAKQLSLKEAPPVIVTIWDEPKPNRWLKASLKQAFRIATTSHELAKFLKGQWGVNEEKVRVMPVGIDPSPMTESRQWTQAVKAWVGLYRRVFEKAVAEFVGWK